MKTLNFFKRFCGAALVLVAMAAPMLTSCYDDSALNEKLEAVQNEVDQIKTDLTQLKSDLAALKAAVDANLSVSQLNQLPDGYELVFSDGTKAVIKNGTSSVVGAKEDEDGVLYWTLNGEWLLDADGNKIKASAEDGETPQVALTLDETDGYYYWTVNGEWLLDAEGNKVRANGIDGKEPEIKMYKSTSYGDIWVWNVNGDVLVDAEGNAIPAQGPAGLDGDAFFESVELSQDGTKLIITLLPEKEGEDKVVYEIPMGAFDIVFDAASAEGVTTDVKKFSYTVSGVSAGDEVIVRVLSTNATGVKVVPESATTGYVELELPSGDGYADIYALNNTTGDLKAKSLKLKGQDFSIDQEVETVLHFSPVEANEVTIPLTTGVEYEIILSDNGKDWLDVTTETRTKAVSYENLILKAAANNSGAHRKTTLTIKKKGVETVFAEFTVEQKNYDPSLIYDEEDEIIEWSESFGVSNSSSGTDAVSKKGVFTIALSDDFSKGVYKISNMFMADRYYHEGQPFDNKGGEYYADIDGGILTVYYAGSVLSYGFTKDVKVAYDASKKEFSISEPLATYSYSTYKDVYLVNYKAVVKVDAPAGDEDSVFGNYLESFNSTSTSTAAPGGYLTIEASDNDAKGNVKITAMLGQTGLSLYGTMNDDKTEIVVPAAAYGDYSPSAMLGNFGPCPGFTLTISNGTITLPDGVFNTYPVITGYSAVKEASAPEVFGDYLESFNSTSTSTAAPGGYLTIEASDNDAKGNVKITAMLGQTGLSLYGTMNDDKTEIVVPAAAYGDYSPSAMLGNFGPCPGFTLTISNGTITLPDGVFNTYPVITGYSATK